MKKDERIKLFAEQLEWALRHYFDSAPDSRNILSNDIRDFCLRIAEDNYECKKELRELFSKSPAYNEEWDYILINGNRTHETDWGTVVNDTINLLRLNEQGEHFLNNCYISNLIDGLHGVRCAEQYAIEKMGKVDDKIYHKGKKVSKMLRALFVALELDKVPDFEARYAKIADECNSKKINFKYILSTNPAFQVTMSNPRCDDRGTMLQSCHSLNSTYEYQNGCSGYARDNYSFITFIPSVFDDKKTWINRKTMRQMFFYKPYNGVLIQSRLYDASGGLYGDQGESMKIYRDLVQREISLCEGEVNSWNTKRYNHYADSEFKLGVGDKFGGYPDWAYSNDFDIRQSIRKGKTNFVKYKAGTQGRCMACGELTYSGDNVFCEECGGGCRCDECDERYNEDDLWYVYNRSGDGVRVCEGCLQDFYYYCDMCEEYHHVDNCTLINDTYYCDTCRDRYFSQCDICGDWESKDDMTTTADGKEVCENCLESDYSQCDECGEWIPDSDAVETADGSSICEDCKDRYYFECEECGEVYPNDEKIEKDGRELCKDCASSEEEIA